MTRKRKRPASSDLPVIKKFKRGQNNNVEYQLTSHPVLDRYYPCVQTLRQFLLTRTPNLSKRRERLLKRTCPTPADVASQADLDLEGAYQLLDHVFTGADPVKLSHSNRADDFQQFTQQLSASTAASIFGQATASYAEVKHADLQYFFIHPKKPP